MSFLPGFPYRRALLQTKCLSLQSVVPTVSEASAAKPGASSAAKPLAYGVFVWYNVGWLKTRFHKLGRHEKKLREDPLEAIEEKVLTWCCSASAAKSAKALDHSGRQSCAAAAAPAFG